MKSKQIQEFKETEIGKIPTEWEITTLENASQLLTDGSHFSPKEEPNGVHFISSVKDMEDYCINTKNCKRISEEIFNELSKSNCKPKKMDVLFSKDGTMGLCFVFKQDEPIVILSSIALIRPNTEFESFFLKYYLSNKKTRDFIVAGFSSGSALPRLTLENLKNVPIIKPNIVEQRQIAKILSDLDFKIEVIQKMNKVLEQITQSIFKSWFIDFDGQTEFIDSELGKIPKGWKVEYFGNVVTITDFGTSGSFASLKKNVVFYYKPEYAILVRAVDFNNNWNGNYVYTNKHGYEFSRKGNIEPGDIMLSNIGNVGTPFFVPDLGKSMTCGKNVLLLKMEQFKKNFIFCYISSDIGQNVIRSVHTGSAVPKFNKTDLKNTKLVYPNEEILKKFEIIGKEVHSQIIRNEKQISILEIIRDSLLPKLMSGEIRV